MRKKFTFARSEVVNGFVENRMAEAPDVGVCSIINCVAAVDANFDAGVEIFALDPPMFNVVAAPKALTVVAVALNTFCVVVLPANVPPRNVVVLVVASPMVVAADTPKAFTVVAVVL